MCTKTAQNKNVQVKLIRHPGIVKGPGMNIIETMVLELWLFETLSLTKQGQGHIKVKVQNTHVWNSTQQFILGFVKIGDTVLKLDLEIPG